jgi:hypothetical protein
VGANRTIQLTEGGASLESYFTFELLNASRDSSFREINAAARSGAFEPPGVQPDQAAVEYARAWERVEWETARDHHAIFTELQAAGVDIDPSTDDVYAGNFSTPNTYRNWNNFENFFTDQIALNHSQVYMTRYHRMRAGRN